MREVLNGIFYFFHKCCQWRAWFTIYLLGQQFRKWQKLGAFRRLTTRD
ncbi:transposase [Euhalothece natronophila Z-M001]|uniref:Transposase n=1 Tax=Euhalothece natronophila Z-M001 TaxID=522448 RepID=A0A5B8NLF0_9CHRO|nr:transposase [Euhalothece natronophila Z-M001]